jgi:Rrf2 family protein
MKRLEYSLRALVGLASAEPATVNARVLADTQDIPHGYLYDVLADLRRAELVQVLRGSHGGYTLTRPASEIRIGTVVRLLEGEPFDLPGGDDPTGRRLRELWADANRAGLQKLDDVTLADIA